MDDKATGIELSLLEGVDENLLTRLHREGIRSRADLEPLIATRDARASLAQRLGVSTRRLLIIHHLNFLLPEERVERLLELERRVDDRHSHVSAEVSRLWRGWSSLAVAAVAALVLAVALPFWLSPEAPEVDDSRLRALEERVELLAPLGVDHARAEVLGALSALGPAPRWNGAVAWTAEDHRRASQLLGDGEPSARAVSLTLVQLARLSGDESAADPLLRAREAAALAGQFPLPERMDTVWDAAGVLLWNRLRALAYGLAPAGDESPNPAAAVPWGWTSPGFLTCETLLARAEAAPLDDDGVGFWMETLGEIRRAAEVGARAQGSRPEAFARHYWIRRAELELAVAVLLLERDTMQPYHRETPARFLGGRLAYLDDALAAAPAGAREPLAWLAVEYAEALSLARWSPGAVAEGSLRWIETVARAESLRTAAGMSLSPEVEARMDAALRSSSAPAARARMAAASSPLLMETRLALRGGTALGEPDTAGDR